MREKLFGLSKVILDLKNIKQEFEIVENENQELKTQADSLRNRMRSNRKENEVINESVYALAKRLKEIKQEWVPNTQDSTAFLTDVIDFASQYVSNPSMNKSGSKGDSLRL